MKLRNNPLPVICFFDVDISEIENERSPGRRLPSYARKAGFFLDTDCLKIGDIFLTTPIKENSTTLAIRKSQSKGYDAQHAVWTHVAIYVGDGFSCEATTKGVVVKDIYEHLEGNKVKFLRCPDLTEHQRYLCAIKALQRLRKPYGFAEIGSLIFEGVSGMLPRTKTNGFKQSLKGAFTCSGLAYEAFLEATQRPPFPDPIRPTPSDFSASPAFREVDIRWVRLPGGPSVAT